MKIKEVQAGVKISRNYNSYQMILTANLENEESVEKVGNLLIEKATEVINKKINENLEDNFENESSLGKEVGAAWFSRDFHDKLSVQYSKDGKWEDVEIKSLEEIHNGYKQKINGEVFIFRKISKEKRKNNKMPVFRIYKKEEK